jgi:hypothetical protein
MRTLQEWMGHRDIQTTMIYVDYAPSVHEGQRVERAFSRSDRQGPGASEGSGSRFPQTGRSCRRSPLASVT